MFVIVMVDDDENVLSSLKRILHKEKDWKIVTFSEPEDALEYIGLNDVEVVISDYNMPSMKGTEFLSRVKMIKPHTMRLILSGYTNVSALMDAINTAQIYRYICKPVDQFELVTTIRRAINHLEVIKENERLADTVRSQQQQIEKQQEKMDRIINKYPDIGVVDRDESGAIVIELDDNLSDDDLQL